MAEGRDARGRFTKGNKGKPKGTVHKKQHSSEMLFKNYPLTI